LEPVVQSEPVKPATLFVQLVGVSADAFFDFVRFEQGSASEVREIPTWLSQEVPPQEINDVTGSMIRLD
jgi:hypothetical protein